MPAFAADVALCDDAGTYSGFLRSVNTPDYINGTNLINPDMSGVRGVPHRYRKCETGQVVEMTQAEQDAVDAASTAARQTVIRGQAVTGVDAFTGRDVKLRAALLVIMDEINILRAQHSLPDRTITQFKNAVKGKINAGDAD